MPAPRCAACVGLGVVPIINENDTVVVDEIRFGDNDTLGALVTNLIEADALRDPHGPGGPVLGGSRARTRNAELVEAGCRGRPGPRRHGGRGGHSLGQRRHAHQGPGSARAPPVAAPIRPSPRAASPTCSRACWRASRSAPFSRPGPPRWPRASSGLPTTSSPPGVSRSTQGAVKALISDGKSLLPIGATAVEGNFGRGEVVSVAGPDGREIARGLVNYSSAETARILRTPHRRDRSDPGLRRRSRSSSIATTS